MSEHKRWVVTVSDVNGRALYREWFWLARNAHKAGQAISSPPLNSYRVERDQPDSLYPPLGRPRWLYRLHAWMFGYFWMPCPICGREFSGWEWGRAAADPVEVSCIIAPGEYRGVCSRRCATADFFEQRGL